MKTETMIVHHEPGEIPELFNLLYSLPDGTETVLHSNDIDEFLAMVESAARLHGTKLLMAGHCLPPNVPGPVFDDAQGIIQLALDVWEYVKSTLNN